MDEPTSSLTLTETERLMKVTKDLRAQGVSIIYISHRLSEIEELADRVIALRDGKNAGRLSREEINHNNMVKLMVGRDLNSFYVKPKPVDSALSFEVRNLRTKRYPNSRDFAGDKAGRDSRSGRTGWFWAHGICRSDLWRESPRVGYGFAGHWSAGDPLTSGRYKAGNIFDPGRSSASRFDNGDEHSRERYSSLA